METEKRKEKTESPSTQFDKVLCKCVNKLGKSFSGKKNQMEPLIPIKF